MCAARKQDPLNRLDPRRPLVIDTRELSRRPGSMRRIHRTVPAPEELRNDVLAVRPGSDVELEVRLEAVMEGVLVTGQARLTVMGECVRCLDPLQRVLDVPFQELYAYAEAPAEEGFDQAVELHLEGDLLDLEQALRDAVVLALPLLPHCSEDCPGLCPDCGARLADEPGHRHEVPDPRWAALASLAAQAASQPADQGHQTVGRVRGNDKSKEN